VEIWFTPETARVVTETVWHHSQKSTFHKDGSVTLKFHVDGLQEIANWVMSWTGRATVVNPPELRDLIVSRLEKALAMNRE
jgi:predicted DNA-binding transcriptional regulator YafY